MAVNTLTNQVAEYLESAGFKILSRQQDFLVADKLLFGRDRDTWLIWVVPPGMDNARYEPTLKATVATHRANYPDAKAYVLSESRGGFSREFRKTLSDQGIKWLVPVWLFDAAFKVEEAPRAASAIADIRSLDFLERRVPQPYVTHLEEEGADLLSALIAEAEEFGGGPTVRVVVGSAGIGKSYLFQALFAQLYDNFLRAKSRHATGSRPIPLMPEHMRGVLALRTELLVENFLRTDVAAPVTRETFEWLLVNGFTTWLLDGLDELYAGDPSFFEYLLDLVTRKGSKAQITIWCRDSLLTSSDAFAEFREYCEGSEILKIYRLAEWGGASKRRFAWLRLEQRVPGKGEGDTAAVASFLREIGKSKTLQKLSSLPFYCHLLVGLSQSGRLREFGDDVAMLDFVIREMIQREVEKGLIDLRLIEKNGLEDWLEQVAMNYIEGRRYADVDRDETLEYGLMVIRDDVDEETRDHMLTSLLQFPFFEAGVETGRLRFAHDLIAEMLAARGYIGLLRRGITDIGTRLSRVDLEDPTLLRYIARQLDESDEKALLNALQGTPVQDRGVAVLVSLLLLARPERDLIKRAGVVLEGGNLVGVHFEGRDLSGISFRHADLSNALFRNCDLTDVLFEGAYLSRTRFEKDNDLRGANFGDHTRIQSIFAGRKFVDTTQAVSDWVFDVTGSTELPRASCPTALQVQRIFGKFVTPLGAPRRNSIKRDGLQAGKRWSGAASPEACVHEATKRGYFRGPDERDRFHRAEGDKYGEVVRFVRDGRISDGIGSLISRLCSRRGCIHQIVL